MEAHRLLVGRYRVLEHLGAQRWAVHWRGHDERCQRPIVVRLLDATLAEDVTIRDRIRQETKAASQITHPNVVPVYDYAEHTDPDGNLIPLVVGGFAEGTSVADRLAEATSVADWPAEATPVAQRPLGGQLPWREVAEAGAQIAAGLSAAHARGVVHRDVTPANLLLTEDGARLGGFGVAAACRGQVPEAPANLGQVPEAPAGPGRVPEAQVAVATGIDCAPELLAGTPGGTQFDIYALGLVMYRAIAGVAPWSPETMAEMLRTGEYVEPAVLPVVPDLPDEVAALCGRCMAREPLDRPSAVELARGLAGATGTTVAIVEPTAETETDGQPLDLGTDEIDRAGAVPAVSLPAAVLRAMASAVAGAVSGAGSGAIAGKRIFRRVRARHYARPVVSRGVLVGIWSVATVVVVVLFGLLTSMVGRGNPVTPAAAAPGHGHGMPQSVSAVPSPTLSQPDLPEPPPGGEVGSPVPPVEISRLPSRAPSRTAKPSSPAPRPTSASPSPSRVERTCAVAVTAPVVWPEGATLNLKVANTGVQAFENWNLTYPLPDGLRVTQGWGGAFSQAGGTVTVRGQGANPSIAPGQTVQLVVNVSGHDPKRAVGTGGAAIDGTPCTAG